MSFQKIGMLKTSKVEILNNLESWSSFKKQASTQVLEQEKKSELKESSPDFDKEFQVIATIDPEKFIYIHTTIMAGVTPEKNGYWITPETEKFINDNNDAWTCEDLLKDYKTFKRATTFVEHDQRLEFAKGKAVDVIARDMGDTILIDVLFSVDKRHKDLVANIESGIINAVSMGCTTAKTICSICGNSANDPNDYCEHLKPGNKGRKFRMQDGKIRRSAEICKDNTFFDVSLVANPAFAGAVFRKILSHSEACSLADILNSKIETSYKENNFLLKAASKDLEIANIVIKNDGMIEIKTPLKSYTASESLTKEEIEKLSSFLPQKTSCEKPVLEKLFEKLFGNSQKNSNHPIQNDSGKKDFSISDNDYSNIPYNNPHDIKDEAGLGDKEVIFDLGPIKQMVILDLNKDNSQDNFSEKVEQFECLKCGFKSELWKIKAASIDNNHKDILECPRCFYTAEESLYKTAQKHEFKIHEKVKIKKSKQIGEIISYRGPFNVIKFEDDSVTWKPDSDLEKVESKKSNLFIASKDIPIDNDEGTYWFDEDGNSVITKGEKVSFIMTVEDGEFGLFKTETGEDFFMPMKLANIKKD